MDYKSPRVYASGMRHGLIGIVVVLAAVVGGVAAQPPVDTPGPAQGGPPAWIDDWTNSVPLDGNQTDPDSLAGKMRVEAAYANETTVTLTRNTPRNFTMLIDASENATNVTFWVQVEAMQASQNISGLVAYIDGNQTSFYVSDQGPGKWVQFVVPSFSERRITFYQVSNELAPGAVRGRVQNAVAFAQTSALGASQVQPNALAGKIRVSAAHAAQMNVSLVANTTTRARLTMRHPNASNVTVYINKRALKASQNIENLTLYIDGRQRAFGVVEENGSPWINFQIDHFSKRTVTFTMGGGGIVGVINDNLILVGGSALAFIVVVGLLLYWRRDSGEPEYVK